MDETGTDGRHHIRKYCYALRGVTPVCLVRGKRFNAIVAMSNDGVIASELVDSTINGDRVFLENLCL